MNASCSRYSVTRLGAILAGAAFALSLALSPRWAAAQSVTVIVNGQQMTFDQPPIVRAGRVFVPLRGVFERLGASVVYANGQINATGMGRTISLTIGSTAATVNGQPVTVDVAPFLVGARTLVPLRFVAQSLGATVDWNDSNSTVTINSGRGGPITPPQRGITLTYRWPTGTIYNHYPQVRFQIDRPVTIGNFHILLDGRDITSGVQYNGQYFYVPVPFSLPMGTHTVRIVGNAARGQRFDRAWTFNQGSY